MIKRFRHRGLKRLYERGDQSAFPAHDVRRLRNILAQLDEAGSPADMVLPGLSLHELKLKGSRKGTWAVTVRANFRVTWKVADDGGFIEIDCEDYHFDLARPAAARQLSFQMRETVKANRGGEYEHANARSASE